MELFIISMIAVWLIVYFTCRICKRFSERLDIQEKTDRCLFEKLDYLTSEVEVIHDTVVTMAGVPVWIARDKDGELWAYDSCPVRQIDGWACKRSEDEAYQLPKTLASITWEDEPLKTWITVTEDRA